MGFIKDKFEAFQDLSMDDLGKATTTSIIEDVFCARTFVLAKISQLVDDGVGQSDKSFSSRAQLKHFKMIDGLLERRFKELKKRNDRKKEKNNAIKQQRSELHKLVDSGLVYSLIKENAKKTIALEKAQTKNEMLDYKHMALMDTQSSELLEKATKLANEKRIEISDAIHILGKEATSVSNEIGKLIDLSVLTENEPITKSNPIRIDLSPKDSVDDLDNEYKGNEEIA